MSRRRDPGAAPGSRRSAAIPQSLRIANICPTPWPARDEVALAVQRSSEALARRGHRVTIIAPGLDRDARADGRRRLDALLVGDLDAIVAEPGGPLAVIAARARTAGGAALATLVELGTNVEAIAESGAFDVVNLYAPLSAGPLLASLRRAEAVTAVTFDRGGPPAGVAFVRGLVDRALARVDVRIAPGAAAARNLNELLPGRYAIVAPGAALSAETLDRAGDPEASGILVIARDRERTAARFALRVLRDAGLTQWDRVVVLAPPDAPWRSRAGVMAKLAGAARVIPDTGPTAIEAALDGVGLVLVPAPIDVSSLAARTAMARGLAVVLARTPEAEEIATDGETGVIRQPFHAGDWATAVRTLIEGPSWRARLGSAARQAAHSWDQTAEALEGCYADALAHRTVASVGTILADLDIRIAPDQDPAPLLEAAVARGLGAVACVSEDLPTAQRAVASAPPGLQVIPGRQIATTDGEVVGLFLTTDVPDGAGLVPTIERIHAAGGLAVAPHPDHPRAPSPEVMATVLTMIDCHALLTPVGGIAADEAARTARGIGVRVSAGSGATRPADVGTLSLRLPAFADAPGLLAALTQAHPVRRRRTLRGRGAAEERVADRD